jgi:hypothetical protein
MGYPCLRPVVAAAIIVISAASSVPAWSQERESTAGAPPEATTMLEQHEIGRLWLSGQVNVIVQTHPGFRAPYSGDNSLHPLSETTTSSVVTLFTGFRVTSHTEVLFDIESAGGRGLSDALGLAGFTDLDVVRNPALGAAPYLARLMLHHTIPLGAKHTGVEPNALALAATAPVRRIEVRVGKLGTADFFDVNAIGSDSHLQFMNWTVDNNGAYDYAADTRGYTWGAVIEYHDAAWALRFGEMLMPTVANGIVLDWNIAQARGENLEVEVHPALVPKRRGTIRLLAFLNHANMGDYREAVERFQTGLDAEPTIENTRQQGRTKHGVGLNVEQPVTSSLRIFARAGWNEGRHESFAYTEVDSTAAFGADYSGEGWHRPHDKAGGAFVSNGISDDHQDYLRLGGKGFLLGDGGLTYGRESIVESYYTAHVWRGVSAGVDVQHIVNPGYNQDRGPVTVFSGRLHVEF